MPWDGDEGGGSINLKIYKALKKIKSLEI